MKNIQEMNEPNLEKVPSDTYVQEERSSVDAFKESLVYSVFNEAKELVENSIFKNFAKIHIIPDIRMAKLEFSINAISISPTALSNLEMTYDTVLNVNFLYNPDVIQVLILVLCVIQ